jgi:hypothetical protein
MEQYRDDMKNLLLIMLTGPPLWFSGCKPRGPGFDSQRCQIFCVVVDMKRGPRSLVMINEELLERDNSNYRLENCD